MDCKFLNAFDAEGHPMTTAAFMRWCFLLTAGALLSACAVGPWYEPPRVAEPLRWGAPDDAGELDNRVVDGEVSAEWWTQFDDPLLTDLIERARRANPDLRIALLRVAQSRVHRRIAAGERTPRIDAEASSRRERQSEFGAATRMVDAIAPASERERIIDVLSEPYDVYQAGFDAAWELDLWGRVRRTVEAADARAAASADDARGAQLTLIAELARTYFELRGAQAQLRIALDDVAASESALALTEERAAGGLVAQLDVANHRARLAEARARPPQLRQRIAQLSNALSALLGEPPGALDAELESGSTPALPREIATGLPGDVVRRRPDVRSAEARLRAATAEIGVAVADLYPRITLTGGFFAESLDASDLTDWGARQWTIGPSLHLPVFQGGRLRAVVELRELEQQEAAVDYQRTVLRAWREVDDALAAFVGEQQRNRELAKGVDASRNAYEIARVRYEHGMTNYLVALDAQRTLLAAQRAYSESSTALFTNLTVLYKALGGGL